MPEKVEPQRETSRSLGAHELVKMKHGRGLPKGVKLLPDGRYSVDLNSRGIVVATKSLTKALTLRDADDIVTTARSYEVS
ncbi:hypothetical protein [Microbacterium sp. A93]|uniref:hypothetical protein n=1 Tax=Microbacterium sp. A93 TaxID=3450716 RepID=UPI003F434623